LPNSFNFVLTGKVAPGHARPAAATALAKLMRLTEERALELLAGKETVVKRNLDGQEVARYIGAFGQIGVEARTEEIFPAPVPAPVSAPVPVPAAAAPAVAKAAPALSSAPAPAAAESVTCPACDTVQPKRNLCKQCGGDMRRLAAAKGEAASAPQTAFSTKTVRVEEDTFTPHPLNVFSLTGRLGRLRYLAYAFPAYLPLIGAAIVGGVMGGMGKSAGTFATLLVIGGLATLWLGLRLAVLRLHDLNLSGFWVLLPIVPMFTLFTGSPVLMIASTGFMLLGLLALFVWPGGMLGNDYGPPSAPNTVWTVIGAVLFILLSLIGVFTGGPPKDEV
jgi:uncharacterized membrane protein YhaH (DUF805 family)